MTENIFFVLAGLGMVLLLVTLWSRSASASREWRILALFAFCLFPIFFLFTALQASFHHMKEVEFCGSCHPMERYHESITYPDDEPLSSVHFRNNYVSQKTACYECHTSYAMFGGVRAKMNGMRHVWVNLTQPNKTDIELYEPYANDNCLHCHGPSERFREADKHMDWAPDDDTATSDFFEAVNNGELSCLKAGCHDLGHYWEEESDDDEDW